MSSDIEQAMRLYKTGETAAFLRQMVYLYTTSYYYERMNMCLRTDDPVDMRKLAPIIFYTREAFRVGYEAMGPFEGTLFRGVHGISDEQISAYKIDQEFLWPAFTSGSTKEEFATEAATAPHWGGRGRPVEFEIRCYGPQDCGHFVERYVACDVQPHSINVASVAEVVLPPYTKYRTVNVKRDAKRVKVWIEAVEFPSMWESIRQLNDREFGKFAERNPEVVAAQGCDHSILNKLAEQAAGVLEDTPKDAPRVAKRAQAMIHDCVTRGANINEVDQQTGAVPLYHIARMAAQTVEGADGGLPDAIYGLVDMMMAAGANPNLRLDMKDKASQGKSVRQLFGDKVPAVRGEEELAPHKWQYFVDDGVSGKATGWYDYEEIASRKVDEVYDQWLSSGASGIQVKSDMFTYDVAFGNLTQVNTSTGKERSIRRIVL